MHTTVNDKAALLRNEPGWFGSFTRNQAVGAIRNGEPVVKQKSEKGDGTKDGTPGIVLGSISHPAVHDGAIYYFVEWAHLPRHAVGCMEWKLRKAEL